jgi:dihydroflavonol-4-reductase
MKAFVTGANGFIGSHLAHKLAARGDTVICLVRDPARAQDLSGPGVRLVKGDITDRASLVEPMRGADAVFHLAGMYKFGPQFISQMRAINVDGARHVLQTAAELGVP